VNRLRVRQIRMARRRPASLHVRQRLSREDTAPAPQTKADWLNSWGTFVSAFSAAIGLLISGIATWATVATLDEQRADSAQSERLRQNERALKVPAWADGAPEPTGGRKTHLIVANYSAAPVTSWGVYYTVDLDPSPYAVRPYKRHSLGISGTIPPCTQMSFTLNTLKDSLDSDSSHDMMVTDFLYEDAAGTQWRRPITYNGSASTKPKKGWPEQPRQIAGIDSSTKHIPGCR
jgi:hypothetical protein